MTPARDALLLALGRWVLARYGPQPDQFARTRGDRAALDVLATALAAVEAERAPGAASGPDEGLPTAEDVRGILVSDSEWRSRAERAEAALARLRAMPENEAAIQAVGRALGWVNPNWMPQLVSNALRAALTACEPQGGET